MFTAHLKNPPTKIYAFVHQIVKDQLMGMAVTEAGTPIEAVILPTRQRVMLALGVGDERSNIHHTYRRLHPNGYELIWINDKDTDPRLAAFRGESKDTPELARRDVSRPEDDTKHPSQAPTSPGEPETDITVALVQAGVERERADKPAAQVSSRANTVPQVDEDKTSVRGTAPSKPKPVVDLFGEL